jgi:hypothetical protein
MPVIMTYNDDNIRFDALLIKLLFTNAHICVKILCWRLPKEYTPKWGLTGHGIEKGDVFQDPPYPRGDRPAGIEG